MLFLVRTEFTRPDGMSDTELSELQSRESSRAKELAESGHLRHLWREPDTFIAWGIWQAEDEQAVRAVLSSLPAHHAMSTEIHPVIDHPNAPRAGRADASLSAPPQG